MANERYWAFQAMHSAEPRRLSHAHAVKLGFHGLLLLGIALLAGQPTANAQVFGPSQHPAHSPIGVSVGTAVAPDFCRRTTLTNGWFGACDDLARNGVTVTADTAHFLQWQPVGERLTIPPGVPIRQTRAGATYGGRGDIFVNIDGGKAGLWEGLSIDAHAEIRFGEAGILRGGALYPTQAALIAPAMSDAVLSLSNLTATQMLGRTTSVTVGRINMIDLVAADPFTGGRGVESFNNIAFVAPPLGVEVVPVVTTGAYFETAFGPMDATNLLFAILDAHGSAVRTGLNSPFQNGTSFMANLTQGHQLFGPSGFVGITVDYSTSVKPALADYARLVMAGLTNAKPMRQASFTTTLSFGQYIVELPQSAAQGWGLFGNIGVSDGDPSPIAVFARLGVSGASPIVSRPLDRAGVAYFYSGQSRALMNAAKPLLRLRDEQGVEAFYNYAVTPWLGVTPNLQIIRPFIASHSVDLFLGLRTSIAL